MDIQAEITAFYKKAAKEITVLACSKSCKQEDYNKLDLDCKTAHYRRYMSSTNDVKKMFCDLLNKIDQELIPSEQSIEAYYKDTDVLSVDKIIDSVKSALEGDIRNCINGSKNSIMQTKSERIISRRINSKYIARIVYYKQNHCSYDKELERAYREIIADETANCKSVLTKTIAKRIQTVSRQITNSAAREVYNMVYNKSTVNEKYKISYGKMADIVNSETPVLLYPQTRANVLNNGSKYYIAVKNEILNAIQPPFSKFMLNIRRLVDGNIDNPNMPSDPYKTYEDFIKNKLGIVCILDYRNIKSQYDVLKEISVCSTIAKKFAQYAVKTRQLFKNRKVNNRSQCNTGKKNQKAVYDIDSRFELVNSLDDLFVLGKMIELYFQMLALSMSEEEYINILKALSPTDSIEIGAIAKIVF